MSSHFIAALGISCYNTCNYQLHDQTIKTSFVQEALLTALDFQEGDKATILLTDFARKKNWEDNVYQSNDISALQRFASEGEILPSEGDQKEGLGSILQKKFPSIAVNDISIPEGKTEEEIWRTFEIVYEQINDGDTVYFDITNGFRSLPMLAMTILNYSKVLKNVEIKGIYYGALEAKDRSTGIVPVFDLTACNDIMNWTIAADNFIHYGNSNLIGELCKNSSDKAFSKAWKNKLQKVVNLTSCIETSRGMEWDAASNKQNSVKQAYADFKDFKLQVQNSDSVEKIVLPLYEKIEERAAAFDKKSNFEIGMATVEWSIQNGMIQQGFTALLETIKTFLCNQYQIEEHDFETRENVAAKALNTLKNCKPALKSEVNTVSLRKQILEGNENFQMFAEQFTQKEHANIGVYADKAMQLIYETPKKLVDLYGEIGDYRNDMNHFGFKKQPMGHKLLCKKLEECYFSFYKMVQDYDFDKLK